MTTTYKNKQKRLTFLFSQYKIISLLLFILTGVFLCTKTSLASALTAENIIKLTNIERQTLELKPLTANQLLTKAAYDKAEAIFNNQTFAHNIKDKTFSFWIKNSGYNYYYIGENLALNFSTAEGALRGWKNSPTHYRNIINPEFKETGVIVKNGTIDGKQSTLVVQIFGAQKKDFNADRLADNENKIKQIMQKTQTQETSINIHKPNQIKSATLKDNNFIKKYFILLSYFLNIIFIFALYSGQNDKTLFESQKII